MKQRLKLSRQSAWTLDARRAPSFLSKLFYSLDRMASRWRPQHNEIAIHAAGRSGEEVAYWFLRHQGYTIVARNYRQPPHKGEIDLIAWHDATLVFVEVKTRSREGAIAAERSVNLEKRRHVIRLAWAYRRRRGMGKSVPYRFDVVSVYGPEDPRPRVALHPGAYRD